MPPAIVANSYYNHSRKEKSFCICFALLILFASSSEGTESVGDGSISHPAAAEATSNFRTAPLTSLLPPTTCRPPSPNAKGTRGAAASLKVVHMHSPCSPLDHGSPTLTHILAQDDLRVNSIHARVHSHAAKSLNRGDGVRVSNPKATLPALPGASLSSGNYIVSVGIGTPMKTISLVLDTGSDLTWTQCLPCAISCYPQTNPIFDPKLSATYSNVSCPSAPCSGLKSATGQDPLCSSSACVYGAAYGDSSFSVGFFAIDRLTLTPSEVVDSFMFGCGQNNRGLFGSTAGLLGLGRDPLSFVSQTAGKYSRYFSYCLSTKGGYDGHLTFGIGVSSAAVKFTPFDSSKGNEFYFIEVESISVGGKQLPISPIVFKTAGMIIDSGTVVTRLPPDAYSAVRAAFRQRMSKYPMAPQFSILDTCYDLRNYTTVTVPKIVLALSSGVSLDLPLVGILLANGKSQVCLAFAGNGVADNAGILGNIQQQTFEIVYDVAGGELGIGAGGCA